MLKEKQKKIINIVVNVIVTVIVILAFAVSINVLANSKKGYIPFFGTATVVAVSDSMDGTQPDSFKKGAELSIKILSDKEKQNIKIGDIITFYDPSIKLTSGSGKALNTHRVVELIYAVDESGNPIDFISGFKTKGDKAGLSVDGDVRNVSNVVGICTGPASGFGKFLVWMQSQAGFFVCVILPVILVALYCVYLVVKSALAIKHGKQITDDKEKLRREVLREMGIDPDSEEGKAMMAAAVAKTTTAEEEKSPVLTEATDSVQTESPTKTEKD